MRTILIWSLTFFLSLTAMSCKNSENLQDLDLIVLHEYSSTKVNVNFCTIPGSQVQTKLKFLFVIDQSTSNQRRPSMGTEIGTDEDGERRYQPIIDMLTPQVDPEEITEDDSIYYGLIHFDTATTVDQPFTNDKDQFRDFVQNIRDGLDDGTNIGDNGWTNYVSSLERIKELITADVEAAKLEDEIISSYYVIFFITDGEPRVAGDEDGDGDGSYVQNTDEILQDIDELSALATKENEYIDSIQINTGYYYSAYNDTNGVNFSGDNPEARDRLARMATRGNGESLVFADNENIDISKFAIPERNIKNILQDIIVLNLTSLWDSGAIVIDSDGDGISDQKEIAMGSNHLNVDSDNDGLSDLVELKVSHTSTTSISSSSCSAIEIASDLDGDSLNNCEERILGTLGYSFDTNNDTISDDIALRYNLGINLTDSNEAQLDFDWDGKTNYHEIKYNTPINYNNQNVFNLTSQKYDLTIVNKTDLQVCYELHVTDILEISNQSLIRVYIHEKASLINNKQFLRIADQVVRQGSTAVFNDNDFVIKQNN